jgi:hypothetical protein
MNIKSIKLAFTFLCLLLTSTTYAHGDDTPGPHGGKIQMPGPFHTEVKSVSDGFLIYLLDMNFENPTVKNSELEASLKIAKKTRKLFCEAKVDHFFCKSEKVPKKSQLILKTKRENAVGNEAIYELPL